MGLAKSIKEEGLNNPVQVAIAADPAKNKGKKYELVAGFRRFMAHRINKAETIQARVMTGISPLEKVIINFTENIIREDLTFMQEARGIEHMMHMGPNSEKSIANKLSKSTVWVKQRMDALTLEPAIQDDIERNVLTIKNIETLVTLPPGEKRYDYVKQIKDAKLRGEKLRTNVIPKNPLSKRVKNTTDIFEMQDHIIETLGSGDVGRLPEKALMLVRGLGWCAGEATDMDIYATLREIATENNLRYTVPEAVMEALGA